MHKQTSVWHDLPKTNQLSMIPKLIIWWARCTIHHTRFINDVWIKTCGRSNQKVVSIAHKLQYNKEMLGTISKQFKNKKKIIEKSIFNNRQVSKEFRIVIDLLNTCYQHQIAQVFTVYLGIYIFINLLFIKKK